MFPSPIILGRAVNLFKNRPRGKWRIEVTEVALVCTGPEGTAIAVRWNGILEIEGFKRDEITTDLICLAISYYEGGKKMIEINEEMDGFAEVERELERQQFLRSDWRRLITLPPFQAKKVVLFTTSKTY